METLRLAGIFLGLTSLALATLVRFRWRRLGNGDWLLANAFALTLLLAGLVPDAFNAILEFFSFRQGGGERIIGLLVFSNLALFYLVFIALARHNRLEHTLDRLVRELAKREFRHSHSAQFAPIYVIIPAYNEAENIGAVLGRVPAEVGGLRVKPIVVVDGATDQTERVVQQAKGAAVSYVINRGGGSALKAGYELALEDGAEIVVTLDADGQHMPEEIPALVQPILDDRADLVNGSRVLGIYEHDSYMRATGVVFFNGLVSLLTGTRITDCSNAFRAIRVDSLRQLELRQTQFHTSELLIEALKKDLRVVEVPITIKRRAGGVSKKGPSVKYAIGFMRAVVGTWLR
jgi:hypothetical protein